jgi:hypothetical protein
LDFDQIVVEELDLLDAVGRKGAWRLRCGGWRWVGRWRCVSRWRCVNRWSYVSRWSHHRTRWARQVTVLLHPLQ